MKLADLGEFGLIARLKEKLAAQPEDVIVGIDDDAAVLRSSPDHLTLLTTDALIEGVHFSLDYFDYYQVGWRAMAANLSDIAAMGGEPQFAVISMGLPKDMPVASVDDLYDGLQSLAERSQTAIVGGDTTSSPRGLFLSIAVVGRVEERHLARRKGARVGDEIFVTGSVGAARAGYLVLNSEQMIKEDRFAALVKKHLTPFPRLQEARFLVQNFPINAMIDISDGLASEIHHICRCSQVGAMLTANSFPVETEAIEVAMRSSEEVLDYALYGGEDFELLFAVPPGYADDLVRKFRQSFDLGCTRIGEVRRASAGVELEMAAGQRVAIEHKGFDHFKPA